MAFEAHTGPGVVDVVVVTAHTGLIDMISVGEFHRQEHALIVNLAVYQRSIGAT